MYRFEEQYIERIWGGRKLETVYGRPLPPDTPIGEAWLISDHSSHESVVADGPDKGRTLHALLSENADAILGQQAELTIHGRFPLLLKILDSAQKLSVQVHPDDECAKRLDESDVGKTEMWHVFHADSGSQLICGLSQDATRDTFAQRINDGSIEQVMKSFTVEDGTSVFVPAGIVHAICEDIVLAEIQQNSDLTYRIYDWGRVQADGTPRELHIDKSLEAIKFGSPHNGPNAPLSYEMGGGTVTVLAACRHFSAELINVPNAYKRITDGNSFHILLGKQGGLIVNDSTGSCTIHEAQAILIPGNETHFEVIGEGSILDYYVPDLGRDVVAPLRNAGHSDKAIVALGGPVETSDLQGL